MRVGGADPTGRAQVAPAASSAFSMAPPPATARPVQAPAAPPPAPAWGDFPSLAPSPPTIPPRGARAENRPRVRRQTRGRTNTFF